MPGRRYEGVSLRRLAAWRGLGLQEADTRWGPLGALETGYSREAPPVAVPWPARGWSTRRRGGA